MKAINSNQFFSIAARALKVVGIVLILSFLLDFVLALFPFQPQIRAWQVNFANQVIERGTIPMVGLALLLAGYWINNSTTDSLNNRRSSLDWRFWAFLFSSLLGLLFLLLFPLHLNNVLQARTQTIQQINQEVEQATTQLQTQIESQKDQFRTQINELLQNEQQFNQALESDQVPEQFKNILRQAQANPQALDQLLEQQLNSETLRNQRLAQIQRRQEEVKQQIQQEVKSGIGISIRSLLVSIGYIIIGWSGLRSLGALQPDHRNSFRD